MRCARLIDYAGVAKVSSFLAEIERRFAGKPRYGEPRHLFVQHNANGMARLLPLAVLSNAKICYGHRRFD
jgi:hypothetical protein